MRKNNERSTPVFVKGTVWSFILAMVFAVSALYGCKGKLDASGEPNGSEIVASIGNEKVTYALYRAAFDSYYEYMTQLGYDPLANEEELESYQDWVLDYIVMDIVVLYNAELEGFTLSEAQEAEAKRTAEDELQSIYDDYWSAAETAAENDGSRTAQEYFDESIAALSEYYIGERLNFDQYSDRYTEELRKSYIIDGFKELVCAEFEPTEEDIAEWYGEQYDSDRKCYTEAPEQYGADQEYFEQFFGVYDDAYPVTYAPDGYSRIMDIVITPVGELGDDYEKKSSELESLYDECTLLMFNDALNGTDNNAERISELLEQYRALKQECDSLYEEFTALTREKIDAAYAELESGANFAEVMMKYTEDTAVIGDGESEGCEAFQTEGRLISLKYSVQDDWSATVKEIFGMLDVGEYSSVFTDEDGSFHIIYHVSDVPEGEIGLDAVRDAVTEIVRAQKGEDDWNELVRSWMEDPALEINMNLVRVLGRNELSAVTTEEPD